MYSNVSTTPRKTVYDYSHNKTNWILGQVTRVTVNDREMMTHTYDSSGRKTSENRYGGAFSRYSYHSASGSNSASNLYRYTDPNGKHTYANYYHRGIPGEIERADGTSDEVEVDDNGWIMGQKDYRGYWTNYERDVMGRITRIIPSKTQKSWLDTTIDYDFGNEITQTVTRGDREEVITYDNFQRVILEKLEDLDGGDTIYTRTKYNEAGEAIFKSFPSFDPYETNGVESEYDGLGRMSTSQENVTPYATTSYDYLDNHRRDVTDPNGNTTSYYYTGYNGPDRGKLLRINQPLGVTTSFTRNVWDQLTRLRQYGTQNGVYMSQYRYYAYDDEQRLCKKSARETNSTLYQYDAAGNMTAYQEGAAFSFSATCPSLSSSAKVSLELDDLYRVTRTNFPAGTPDIYTTYDANGNVQTLKRDGADWFYTYDELNNLIIEGLQIDGRSYITVNLYNTEEEITDRFLPGGNILGYEYDGLNRVTSIGTSDIGTSDGATNYASNIGYHPNGVMRRLSYGNSLRFGQGLNARMLPSYLSVETDDSSYEVELTYLYDNNGNVTYIRDDVLYQHQKEMTYDALNRIETASGYWGEGRFNYDALGNLRSKTLGSRTVTNNYSSSLNRITSSNDSVGSNRLISYDSRGNVTRLGDLDFSYDHSNQPVQISGSSAGSYKYDGNKKRVKSVVDGKRFIIFTIKQGDSSMLIKQLMAKRQTTYD